MKIAAKPDSPALKCKNRRKVGALFGLSRQGKCVQRKSSRVGQYPRFPSKFRRNSCPHRRFSYRRAGHRWAWRASGLPQTWRNGSAAAIGASSGYPQEGAAASAENCAYTVGIRTCACLLEARGLAGLLIDQSKEISGAATECGSRSVADNKGALGPLSCAGGRLLVEKGRQGWMSVSRMLLKRAVPRSVRGVKRSLPRKVRQWSSDLQRLWSQADLCDVEDGR